MPINTIEEILVKRLFNTINLRMHDMKFHKFGVEIKSSINNMLKVVALPEPIQL